MFGQEVSPAAAALEISRLRAENAALRLSVQHLERYGPRIASSAKGDAGRMIDMIEELNNLRFEVRVQQGIGNTYRAVSIGAIMKLNEAGIPA